MFTDSQTSIIKHQMQSVRTALVALIPDDVDLDEFYKTRICKHTITPLTDKAKITRHCVNWLYTKKCETQYSGKEFLEFLLWALRETLKYVTNELQEEFTCYLIDLCLKFRREHLYN